MANSRNNPTLRDIAHACNMDVSTVSRALRGDVRVKLDTANKIRELAQSLGYRPNLAARSLAAGKTNTILFIISSLKNPIELLPCEAASTYLREQGYDMLTAVFERDEEVLSRLLQRLGQGVADGAIFIPGGNEPLSLFEIVHREKIPMVMVDRYLEDSGFAHVTTDNSHATIQLIEMCVQRGCRDVVYVSNNNHNTVENARVKGARKAAEKFQMRWHDYENFHGVTDGTALAVISSSQESIHNFLGINHVKLSGSEMYLGVFDFWYGEPFPAKAVMVAIQDAKEIAHSACKTLLASLETGKTKNSAANIQSFIPLKEIRIIDPKF